MSTSTQASPEFLDKIVHFPDGASYNLLRPLTDYRACHDGTPLEARILYICRRSDSDGDEEYVVKVKVQYVAFPFSRRPSKRSILTRKVRLPGNSEADRQAPAEGPSTTTALELKALEIFRKANSPFAPQLLGFKRAVQSNDCPLPGGYITYTLMNKVDGDSLFDLHYWALPEDERQDIIQHFLEALRWAFLDRPSFTHPDTDSSCRAIHGLGIQPEDRALRNVMWDRQHRTWYVE